MQVSVGDSSVAIGDGRGISVCPASGEVEVEYLSDHCRVLTVTLSRPALERELEAMLAARSAPPSASTSPSTPPGPPASNGRWPWSGLNWPTRPASAATGWPATSWAGC